MLACMSGVDPGSGFRAGGSVAPGEDGGTTDGGTTSGDAGTDAKIPHGPSVVITPQEGQNVFDLGAINPALTGAKVIFNASLSAPAGSISGKMYIDSTELDNGSSSGLRMLRPTWTLEDAAETPLGTTHLDGVDLSVPKGRKSPFPEQTLFVDRYTPTAKLRVSFATLAASAATSIEGLPATRYIECEAPQLFSPAVSRHYKATCRGCHGDSFFSTEFLGRDDATACGMSKPLLQPGGPNLLRPTQAGHAGGVMPEASAYTQALTAWRTAEQ